MKNTLLSSLFLLFSIAGFSQAIPNNDFENWAKETQTPYHFNVPAHWVTSDEIENYLNPSYNDSSVEMTTTSYSGKYAVRLRTCITANDTVTGKMYSTDSLSSIIANIHGADKAIGFPDSIRSAYLQGYFWLYAGAVYPDTGIICVILTKWNKLSNQRDTLVDSKYALSTWGSGYSLFNMPLNYLINSENPDTALITAEFDTYGDYVNRISPILRFDDLSFSGIALGTNEIPDADKKVSIYPNPFSTSATLTINAAISADNNTVEIYNALGQTVRTINNVNSSSISIERGNLQSGLYFYRLINAGSVVSTGKFIVE